MIDSNNTEIANIVDKDKRRTLDRRTLIELFLKSAGLIGLSAVGFPVFLFREKNLDEQVKSLDLSDENLAYCYVNFPFQIGDNTFQLFSVAHWPPTFKKYRGLLEKSISEASYVALEYFTAEMQNYGKLSGEPEESLYTNPGSYNELVYRFFGLVARLCAQYGKDIIVVNPQNSLTAFVSHYSQEGALISAGALSGLALVEILKRGLTRRDFLKAAPLIFNSIISTYGAIATGSGYTEMDFRDVGSALGILKFLSDKSNAKFVLIQGAGHDAVQKYVLDDTNVLKQRYSNYVVESHIGNSFVQVFHYKKESDVWKKISEIPYFPAS